MTRILPTDAELLFAQFIWGKMREIPFQTPIETLAAIEELKRQNVPMPKNLIVCFASDFLLTPWWEDKRSFHD